MSSRPWLRQGAASGPHSWPLSREGRGGEIQRAARFRGWRRIQPPPSIQCLVSHRLVAVNRYQRIEDGEAEILADHMG